MEESLNRMKYVNSNCRKVKNSHLLLISCAYCQTPIARYQKVGGPNLIKMYNERIVDGNINFSEYHGALFCPSCGEQIATRYITKSDNKEVYRLLHGCFHKKKL